eukprot:8362561-Pyramimonas_sp.AAC.1
MYASPIYPGAVADAGAALRHVLSCLIALLAGNPGFFIQASRSLPLSAGRRRRLAAASFPCSRRAFAPCPWVLYPMRSLRIPGGPLDIPSDGLVVVSSRLLLATL